MFAQMPKISAYIQGSASSPFAISYFALTKRNGSNSFYSVSAPYSSALADALLTAYNSGLLVYVTKNGATLEFFNIEQFDYDIGPNSSSITITGFRQETITGPVTYAFDPGYVLARNTRSDGTGSLDVVPFAYATRPGDSITYAGVTKVVNNFTLVLTPGSYQQTFNLNA